MRKISAEIWRKWLDFWLVQVCGCILCRKSMRMISGWVEENMKKVVARGKEATSPPPVPVEPLPCLTSGPPGPRPRLNKRREIVNHYVCVYLIYEKHSPSIFLTLNKDLQLLKIKLWSQDNMGSGRTYLQSLQPIMTSLFVSLLYLQGLPFIWLSCDWCCTCF